ncbi:hypothetical protein DSECCO2_274830 [anaerobic digester metagenome]
MRSSLTGSSTGTSAASSAASSVISSRISTDPSVISSVGASTASAVSVVTGSSTLGWIISTLSGRTTSGGMIRTDIPRTPGLSGAVANPCFTYLMDGSPHFLMYPSVNFAQADLDPLILPEIVTSTPWAPAPMILRRAEYATRRKCIPLWSMADIL